MTHLHRNLIQNYKGYIKEAGLYAKCLMRRTQTDLGKFVIFGVPRSGTELLVSLLDSHPQIHCEGELWKHKLVSPQRYLACHAKLCAQPVFGFKLLVAQVELQGITDAAGFIRQLHASDYRIISLRRRNLYRAALSSLYGSFLGRYFLVDGDSKTQKQPMTLHPPDLVRKIELFEDLSRRHQDALGDTPCIELFYEDNLLHVANHQASVDRICDYLKLVRHPMSTNLVKMASEDVSDFVVNAQEIEDYLQSTSYAGYLEVG